MLYLEDFIELIEHLPDEVRNKLSEVKDIDLHVQNTLDNLEHKSENYFSRAKRMKPEDREKEYEKLMSDYNKISQESQEKIDIADKMHVLFSKHLNKLDQELNKFKLELEADNAGITEILEKRSLELDGPSTSTNIVSGEVRTSGIGLNKPGLYPKHKNKSLISNLVSNATKRINRLNNNRKLLHPSAMTYKLGVTKTSNQDRGLKRDSNEAIGGENPSYTTSSVKRENVLPAYFEDEQILDGISSPSRYSSSSKDKYNNDLEGRPSRIHKAKNTSLAREMNRLSNTANSAKRQTADIYNQLLGGDFSQTNSPFNLPEDDQLYGYEIEEEDDEDPDEPRYCICNQVSYGEMVACDNPSCPYEWFHYACVGVTQPPKGKWFCPECSISAVF